MFFSMRVPLKKLFSFRRYPPTINFPFPPDGKGPEDPITEQDKPYYSESSNPYAQASLRPTRLLNNSLGSTGISTLISSLSPQHPSWRATLRKDDSTTAGFQYLVKNRIAPNASEVLYTSNPYFAMIGVEDVAKSIYAAINLKDNHGVNLLLSSESYTVSDMHLLLNGKNAIEEPIKVYSSEIAEKRLNLKFRPMKEVLKGIYS